MPACPFETFPALARLPVIHAFTGRVPDLNVKIDRAAALRLLEGYHDEIRGHLGIGTRKFITAEQIHGNIVRRVHAGNSGTVPGADGLITDDPSVCLGIYVADCGPIWLVDPVQRAIGCVHSGKKGTEGRIVVNALDEMVSQFGCDRSDIIAQLGPCIRPPHYEVDFAADILRQCRDAGLTSVHDSAACTASDVGRYYSYRSEMGQTGRMLAILALA